MENKGNPNSLLPPHCCRHPKRFTLHALSESFQKNNLINEQVSFLPACLLLVDLQQCLPTIYITFRIIN